MNVIAKLVPPHMDKSYSFQAHDITPEQRLAIIAATSLPGVKLANPFRQGDSGRWIMIEFWTKDRDVIQVAANLLADSIGVHDLAEGDFTRHDLGLC